MQANIGAVSRAIRLIAGIVLLVLLWRLETPWGLLGLALIASAVVGWCPLCTAPRSG